MMMSEELNQYQYQLLEHFQQEVQRATDQVCKDVEKDLRFEVEVEFAGGDKRRIRYFLNEVTATTELRRALEPIEQKFLLSAQTLPPQLQEIFNENLQRAQQVVEQANDLFLIQFHSNFVAHLKDVLQSIEKEVTSQFQELESAKAVTCSPNEFKTAVLPAIYANALLQLRPPSEGAMGYYSSSEKQLQELDDSEELLQRFYSNLHGVAVEQFEARYKVMKEKIVPLFEQTCTAMEKKIPLILQQLCKEHANGFPRTLAMSSLDQEYKQLDEQLRREIIALNHQNSSTPFLVEAENSFIEFCKGLNDFLTNEYETLRNKEFVATFLPADEEFKGKLRQHTANWQRELKECLENITLAPTAEAVASIKVNSQDIMNALDDLLMNSWRRAVSSILGWLSDIIPAEELPNERFLLESTLMGQKLFEFLKIAVIPLRERMQLALETLETHKREVIAQRQQEEANRKTKQEEMEFNDNYTKDDDKEPAGVAKDSPKSEKNREPQLSSVSTSSTQPHAGSITILGAARVQNDDDNSNPETFQRASKVEMASRKVYKIVGKKSSFSPEESNTNSQTNTFGTNAQTPQAGSLSFGGAFSDPQPPQGFSFGTAPPSHTSSK